GHAGGLPRRPGDCRRLQCNAAALGDIKAGLRSGLENTPVLQQTVGLQRGRKTGLSLLADLTKRGNARSRPQRAAVHETRDEVRELLISVRWICRHSCSLLQGPRSILTVMDTISIICNCYRCGWAGKPRDWSSRLVLRPTAGCRGDRRSLART